MRIFFFFKSTTVLYLLDWNKSIPNFTVKSKNPMYFQRSRETIISIYVLYLHNTKIHRRLNFTKCMRNFKSTRFINSGINYMHCLIILWGENLIWTVSSFLFYQFWGRDATLISHYPSDYGQRHWWDWRYIITALWQMTQQPLSSKRRDRGRQTT